jgi:hypothetical protein
VLVVVVLVVVVVDVGVVVVVVVVVDVGVDVLVGGELSGVDSTALAPDAVATSSVAPATVSVAILPNVDRIRTRLAVGRGGVERKRRIAHPDCRHETRST